MKTVMERLRELRENHDLSQAEVAAVMGITQQYYSEYENQLHELPLRHFITLANYYHVSADYLIGRCRLDESTPLKMIYVTRDYTCEQFLKDTLSLSDKGRQAVMEYVELQKMKESVGK